MPRKLSSGMWLYLDKLGILEGGTDEEIKAAKREYRKGYFRTYKRERRTKAPEIGVVFPKETGELEIIQSAAKRHGLSLPAFIRQSSVAYINQTFVVPELWQVARIEQAISQVLDDIRRIASKKSFFSSADSKLEAIESRLEALEQFLRDLLKNPKAKRPTEL